MNYRVTSAGSLIRSWREQRGLTQLALACEANISQKHLSFIESGRAAPSRDMVLHLAEHLDIPLRERNTLLLMAGYAPIFRDRPITDPALERARAAIERVLKAHEPYPALTVDRHWTIVSANSAVAGLLTGVDPALLNPPINVMRLSLHPRGLAPLIVNLAEWRRHLLDRLRRQFRMTHDPAIEALLKELSAFPGGTGESALRSGNETFEEIVVPLRLRTHAGVLSLLSTITVFGTPVEITLSELSVEAFYPADEATAEILRAAQSTPK